MDIRAIQHIADNLGLEYSSYARKVQLIRAIQERCGQSACFATDKRFSCSGNCTWRTDCQKPIADWLR